MVGQYNSSTVSVLKRDYAEEREGLAHMGLVSAHLYMSIWLLTGREARRLFGPSVFIESQPDWDKLRASGSI